jgi:hypothetical protein
MNEQDQMMIFTIVYVFRYTLYMYSQRGDTPRCPCTERGACMYICMHVCMYDELTM